MGRVATVGRKRIEKMITINTQILEEHLDMDWMDYQDEIQELIDMPVQDLLRLIELDKDGE